MAEQDTTSMSNVIRLDIRLRDDVSGFYASDLMLIACSKSKLVYLIFGILRILIKYLKMIYLIDINHIQDK